MFSKKLWMTGLLLSSMVIAAIAQDKVLFTVGDDTEVTVDEFKYIYTKTNSAQADFSKQSLEDYLDLYIQFKLKVERARDMQLDTIPALKRELDGYRKQLASNYLMDKAVLDNLVAEAYTRMQQDVKIAHIFLRVAEASQEAETQTRITEMARAIQNNEITFEDAAKEYSQDGPTAQRGGVLGYITAFSLGKFYEIENAAYSLEVGEVSEPVRSALGFHLIKVLDQRPARGTVEAAHILVRITDKVDAAAAQTQIETLYDRLQKGENTFEAFAQRYSDDERTKLKGGNLGIVNIGEYDQDFEDAIFNLANDGDFSKPVRSSVGWHIVKRVRKTPMQSLEEMSRSLRARIQRDSRFEKVQEQYIESLKADYDFELSSENLVPFRNEISSDFTTAQWKHNRANDTQTAFYFADKTYTVAQVADYMQQALRSRTTIRKAPQAVYDDLLKQYIGEELLAHEEAQLADKYPDFRALLREYEEGILLFEATNREVWGKASSDTLGLKAFYDANQGKYLWNERIEVTTYRMPNEHPTKLAEAKRLAKKNSPDAVLKAINTEALPILEAETRTYEYGQNANVDALERKAGYIGFDKIQGDVVSFMKVERVIAPQPRTFEEAKGYVIADYQKHLETEWLKSLRDSYKVKVNKKVLKTLIAR